MHHLTQRTPRCFKYHIEHIAPMSEEQADELDALETNVIKARVRKGFHAKKAERPSRRLAGPRPQSFFGC